MKLGILADIHEELEHLRRALDALRDRGADRLIVLGDLFELGHRLDATVELLDEAGAVGVWGNHDFGLCRDPHEDVRRRFNERTMAFMGRLGPRLEVEGCLFVHVEPWLDPERIEDLWYFDDEPWYRGHRRRWGSGSPASSPPRLADGPSSATTIAGCSPRRRPCCRGTGAGRSSWSPAAAAS